MNIQTGIINIRGKEYQTVALRVQMFRERFPEHSLLTRVVERTPDCVVMVASIEDPAGRTIATGHAEEYRSTSQINKTSALENAETSAIGRALAAFGIGGTEFASANEVQNAIHQQGAREGSSEGRAFSPPAADPVAQPITDEQWAKIVGLCQASGVQGATVKAHIKATNLKVLTPTQFTSAVTFLEEQLAEKAKAETNAKVPA